MRVIICGAGQVGYSIASYLAREENDVTVIDTDPNLIAHINDDLDISGIVGHASNPDVLFHAGAQEADLIIAVTFSDEVNMVACQVAHSLFSLPKKIARIRERSYLDPVWSNLFSRSHMPIDVIISPEKAVAEDINKRLHTPGTTNVLSLAEGKINLAGVICGENCPVINTQLSQLESLFPNLPIEIGAILRGSQTIIPNGNDQILAGDEVYFFTDSSHLKRSMAAFGHEEKKARNIVIMGGGNIGLYLVNLLQEDHANVNIKIIESNEERAKILSEKLPNTTILYGDTLQRDILEEANIKNTETLVAVTNDDETNILGSLLAKHYGCERVITLINKTTYMPLTTSLGIDAVVSPRSSTASTIMRHVRRGRIKELYTLRDGFAEVLTAEVSETSSLANKALEDVSFPERVVIGPIIREGEVLMPAPDRVIKPGDHVITLAAQEQARKVEKMFTTRVALI